MLYESGKKIEREQGTGKGKKNNKKREEGFCRELPFFSFFFRLRLVYLNHCRLLWAFTLCFGSFPFIEQTEMEKEMKVEATLRRCMASYSSKQQNKKKKK